MFVVGIAMLIASFLGFLWLLVQWTLEPVKERVSRPAQPRNAYCMRRQSCDRSTQP